MKKLKDLPVYVLGSLIITGFFVVLALLVFKPIPPENKDLLNMVVGALIASFTMLVSYYFGSSKGSSDKNEIFKNRPNEKI